MEELKAKELPKRGTNTYLSLAVRAYLDILAKPRETWSETLDRILPAVIAQCEMDPGFRGVLENPTPGGEGRRG